MKRGAILLAVIFASAGFSQIEEIPSAAREQVVAPDVVEEIQHDKFAVYEQNKIVISDYRRDYESADEWNIRAWPSGFSAYDISNWYAYRSGVKLEEDGFFDIANFPDKAKRVRNARSTYRIMKWCSPFLIIGGVLMSGFSSQWGSGETNTYTPIGVGISVLGLIAGAEGMSKGSRNVFRMTDAIPAMGAYNERLKDSLGIIDTFVQTSMIQTVIDTSGIAVVPYKELDEGFERIFILDSFPTPPDIPHVYTTLMIAVECLIDTNGNVAACDILKSSGSKRLDTAAIGLMRKTKFAVPRKNGKPVFTRIVQPIAFGVDHW